MKKQIKFTIIFIGIFTIFSDQVYSESPEKIRNCVSQAPEQNPGFKIEKLPPTLLIARSANFEVEGNQSVSSQFKIKSSHQFIHPRATVDCASFDGGQKIHEFFLAPVIIDNRNSENLKMNFWQFHIAAKSDKINLLGQKENIISKNLDFKKWINTPELKVELFQIAHDQYVIKVKQSNTKSKKMWTLHFDSIEKLN